MKKHWLMWALAALMCLGCAHGSAESGAALELPGHFKLAEGFSMPAAMDEPMPRYEMREWDMVGWLEKQPLPQADIASWNKFEIRDGMRVEARWKAGGELYAFENTLCWNGENEGKYHQLFTYLNSGKGLTLPDAPLDFMTRAEAVALCQAVLDRLEAPEFVLTGVYALNLEDIVRYTAEMAEAYKGMKLDYFKTAEKKDEIYCIVYDQQVNGILTLGDSRCVFYVRSDGIVGIDMRDRMDAASAVPILAAGWAAGSPEEALRRLAAWQNPYSGGDWTPFEVTGMAPGYIHNWKTGNVVLEPGWRIEYEAAYTAADGTQKTVRYGAFVRAADGTVCSASPYDPYALNVYIW